LSFPLASEITTKSSSEPLAKLASEDDLMAETAKKRRVPILPGVKIGLHTKPKRTWK
jgi:hypothetical protein